MLEFQSDLEYISSPPPGHIYKGVDLMHRLDGIRTSFRKRYFNNEYDFQLAIFGLLQSVHDGHLAYVPDIIGAFNFVRIDPAHTSAAAGLVGFSLVSISKDGRSLPDIYAASDIHALRNPSSARFRPSPIIEMDGIQVETWLNRLASISMQSDPDASYNDLFPNIPAQASNGSGGGIFASSLLYPELNTTLVFANGTERQTSNVAILAAKKSLAGVRDGKTFFKTFCSTNYTEKMEELEAIEKKMQETESPAKTEVVTHVPYTPIPTDRDLKPPHTAYPAPIATMQGGAVAGYFPSSRDDLAVLSIPSFMGGSVESESPVHFENIVRQVLATAKAENRTKLIIDVRGNPGGRLFLPYDLFHQLFPSSTPRLTRNYRAHEVFDLIGQIAAESSNTSNYLSPFNVSEVVNASSGSFHTWEEFYGPQIGLNGGNFTSPSEFNLSYFTEHDLPIYGFGNNTRPQPQTFEADQILLLQDGTCASSCALLSELLKSQAGVRSVVVGGRKQDGPMQGVGGTKGGEVRHLYQLLLPFDQGNETDPLRAVRSPKSSLTEETVAGWKMAMARSAGPFSASVNFENVIREGDDSLTPLQFVYEAADCRFFYTAEMYHRQEAIWDRAYDWAWGNDDVCVPGSTEQESSRPGLSYILSPPPPEAQVISDS